MKAATKTPGRMLTPFIVLFALAVLLTVILLTVRENARKRQEQERKSAALRLVTVNPDIPPEETAGILEEKELDPERVLSLALSDIKSNHIEAAEKRLKALLFLAPDNPRVLSILGNIYFIRKNYKDAEKTFLRQLEVDPGNILARHNLAAALAKQYKFHQAIEHFNLILEKEPDSPPIIFNLAGLYAASGDRQKALDYFRRAYELLGERILPLSGDPGLDSIRDTEEFMMILTEAQNASGQTMPEKQQEGESVNE